MNWVKFNHKIINYWNYKYILLGLKDIKLYIYWNFTLLYKLILDLY